MACSASTWSTCGGSIGQSAFEAATDPRKKIGALISVHIVEMGNHNCVCYSGIPREVAFVPRSLCTHADSWSGLCYQLL